MIDDYQYTSTPLPPKSEELFGLGGKPSEGSKGLAGSISDSGSRRASTEDPLSSMLPGFTNGGNGGGYDGGAFNLPEAIKGNILYYDLKNWKAFKNPNSGGVLINDVSGELQWLIGLSANSVLYYDGNENRWRALAAPPPTTAQDKYLVIQGGNLTWGDGIPRGSRYGDILYWDGVNNWITLSAPSGEGTYILANSGGTPYWIETVDCGATGAA